MSEQSDVSLRLAMIEHRKCDETQATTYVWVPADKSEADFEADVQKAQTAYLAAMVAARDFAGPRPHNDGFGNMSLQLRSIKDEPDNLTVGELKARSAKAEEDFKAWEARRKEAIKPFSSLMEDLGYIRFWNHDPDLSATLDWGHHHGEGRLENVEDTRPMDRDLKGSLRKRQTQTKSGRLTTIGHEDYIEDPSALPDSPHDT